MKALDKSFWEARYAEGQTGWDIGYASPPLTTFMDQQQDKDQRILLPGVGYGHEAVYLFNNGFTNVSVIDIAEAPLQNLARKLPKGHGLELINDDFFNHQGKYDLILEQTFLCALDPSLRLAYAEKMLQLLNPGGTLAGVLFDFEKANDDPPFGGSLKEYQELFRPYFHIKTLARCTNSIKPRQGNELFFIFEKPQADEL